MVATGRPFPSLNKKKGSQVYTHEPQILLLFPLRLKRPIRSPSQSLWFFFLVGRLRSRLLTPPAISYSELSLS